MGRDLRVFPLEFLPSGAFHGSFILVLWAVFLSWEKKMFEENQLENSTKNVYLVDLIRQERV